MTNRTLMMSENWRELKMRTGFFGFLVLSFFFDYQRRLPASTFILQEENACHRSPSSLPELASLDMRSISIKPISEPTRSWKSRRWCGTLPWRSCRLGKPLLYSLSPIVLGINVLNNVTPTVLPQARGVKKNAKSSHLDNNTTHTAESISPQPSTSSLLSRATPVPGYATDTHSLLNMGSQHCSPYCVPEYIPVSTYPPHVSSHQSTSSQCQ